MIIVYLYSSYFIWITNFIVNHPRLLHQRIIVKISIFQPQMKWVSRHIIKLININRISLVGNNIKQEFVTIIPTWTFSVPSYQIFYQPLIFLIYIDIKFVYHVVELVHRALLMVSCCSRAKFWDHHLIKTVGIRPVAKIVAKTC